MPPRFGTLNLSTWLNPVSTTPRIAMQMMSSGTV